MDKTNKLKEMIVGLKIDLIKTRIPEGFCPYTYYKPSAIGKRVKCKLECEKCRVEFLQHMEFIVRKEIESI